MKKINILIILSVLALSCSGQVAPVGQVNELYVYGSAAENIDESRKVAIATVFSSDNVRQTGEFELFLDFSEGQYIMKDGGGSVWTLMPDGTIEKDAGESILMENGIYRIRVDFDEMKWSKIKINSISYRSFFGERTTIDGTYSGKGNWSFKDIPLSNPDKSVKYYRFDIDSESPEELSYLVYTNNVNDSDPESYKSSYQYVRSLGADDITMADDGSVASWRFRAEDKGVASIELKLNKSQARHIHYVNIVPPGPPAAFIGDSITERWNKSNTGRPEFFSSNSYLCFGKSGETSTQILSRFEQNVISNSPQCVVILCGTNDIAGNQGTTSNEDILKNIADMADMARDANIKVILCSVLPCDYYYWKPNVKPQDRIDDLNNKIKDLASASGYTYVDYFTSMADENRGLKEEYQADDCHPNQAGYDVMQAIIKPIIDKTIE